MYSEGKWLSLQLVEFIFHLFRILIKSKMGVLKTVDEHVYSRIRFLLTHFS